jgi:hypothetical protein
MSWYIFIEGVDIDAKVFTHQANAERVSKPTDFEWLSSHFSASTREKCGKTCRKSRLVPINHLGVTNHCSQL